MLSSVTGVNVLAPTWFFLDSTDGALADLTSTSYVEEAHDRGIQVWAVMNDFDGEVSSSSATAEALMTDASRSAMIDAVLEGLRNCGADGLCIDFEHVTDKSVSDFLEFVRECSGAMRTEGKVLSVCNYVPTFTKYMNRKEQGRVVDYVITMCYDEHTSGSKEAGSVASYGFVRDGIEDTAEDVPPEKLIAAIPFYTRLWETKGSEAPSSTAYGMSDAQKAVDAAGMTTVWDDTARQYYAEKDSGNVRMQIWLEEARSVSEKMSLIRKAGCAGVAEWKLGFETDDIWEVISEESPD